MSNRPRTRPLQWRGETRGPAVVTYSRRGLHGQVVDDLGRRIVRGDLPPGTVVDLEAMELDLDVSRTVVREAVKVLTTKGLLDARPRFGTFVRERRHWNLLDADVMVWRNSGEPDERLITDLAEVRRIVEPAGARLAAQRRTDADIAALRDALDRMHRSGRTDIDEHVLADLDFHRALLGASQNELLERLEVVLEPALRARDALAFTHALDDAFLAAHSAVADAVIDGDADRAEVAMAALLDAAAADTAEILEQRRR